MAKQKQINSLGSLMSQAKESLPEHGKVESKEKREKPSVRNTMSKPEKGKVGRKPRNRTIARTNGMSIYLEDRHRQLINRIGGFDKQDIIRTALDEFLKIHYTNGNISERGRELIEKYVESTTDAPLIQQEIINEDW